MHNLYICVRHWYFLCLIYEPEILSATLPHPSQWNISGSDCLHFAAYFLQIISDVVAVSMFLYGLKQAYSAGGILSHLLPEEEKKTWMMDIWPQWTLQTSRALLCSWPNCLLTPQPTGQFERHVFFRTTKLHLYHNQKLWQKKLSSFFKCSTVLECITCDEQFCQETQPNLSLN